MLQSVVVSGAIAAFIKYCRRSILRLCFLESADKKIVEHQDSFENNSNQSKLVSEDDDDSSHVRVADVASWFDHHDVFNADGIGLCSTTCSTSVVDNAASSCRCAK